MAEVTLGTAYELNRQLLAKVDDMKEQAIINKMNEVGAWLSSKPNSHYYMLLCRERNDYTIFRIIDAHYYEITQEMIEVFQSRGAIVAINYSHVCGTYEVWIRVNEDEQPYLFMLFDCDDMIVEA